MACSSHRSNTELEDELEVALFPEGWSASVLNDCCGGDVGDELLPELTDNPGKTRGTKLPWNFPFAVNTTVGFSGHLYCAHLF